MDEKDYMDGEEKEAYEQERANEANANVVSNAADVAIASGNPYAMAAGAIVKVGDSQTDGHVSKSLGKATTVINKHTTSDGNIDNSMLQKGLNNLAESGTADKVGTAASIYSMGKGGAGAASKGAEAASSAAEASSAASKASQAAQKAESAASKANTAEKAADAAKKAEEASQAAQKAEEAKNAADTAKSDFQKRQEANLKANNNTKIVDNRQKKNPYTEQKRSDERDLKEIVDDKVDEKKAKEQSDPNKPKYEEQDTSNVKNKQLDQVLDVVDVATDVIDSAATKSKKWIKLLIFLPVVLPVLILIFIIMVIASMFGADLSIGPHGGENPTTQDTEIVSNGNIQYTYPNNLQIRLEEDEFISGVIYYELYSELDSYYAENINMKVLYEVYGTIYKLNLINKYNPKDNQYSIDYNDYIYCNINGCYQIEDNGNSFYVDSTIVQNNNIQDTINILSNDQKEILKDNVKSGIIVANLISEINTSTITIDDSLKNKIKDYVKDNLSSEEILNKLGINTNISE